MSQIVIYGASDDLIEVDGDVPGCDEYNEESARLLVRGAATMSAWMAVGDGRGRAQAGHAQPAARG